MWPGHHSADNPQGAVDPRHGEHGERAMPLDLHVGWVLVHRDWGVRQRESRDAGARRLARLVEAVRAIARRLAVMTGGGGSGMPRSSARPPSSRSS